MNDDDITRLLRSKKAQLTAVEMATFLSELTGRSLTQGALISYFQRAFPMIPLRVLLDSSAWIRLSHGGLSDDGFNALLQPWLPGESDTNSDTSCE